MKLSLVIRQARSGELASVSIKNTTDEKIVDYLNLALIALYNRFQLATEEAIITLRPDIPKTVYTFDSTDADVKVAGQPMVDDSFMAVVAAWDEDGVQISINDNSDPRSIFTVGYNQVQVPLLGDMAHVSVIYRTNPPLVEYVDDGNGNAVDTNIKLPMQLLEAALHYIGYRAHGAIDGSIQAETSTHYTRFVAACNLAAELGVLTADDVVNKSFHSKGFL